MRRVRSAAFGIVVALGALTGCGRMERLQACNIATSDCQRSVYYAVVRLRGDGWDPFDGLPPIQTITLARYRKELTSEQDTAKPSMPSAAPAFDPWSDALQLLGLLKKSSSASQASVDSQVNNVAAFYSSATRKVTVIDRGDARDDRSDTTLLAHELVHAFQDNEVSSAVGGPSTDGSFAGRALIEGEAVLYEHLAGAEIDGYDPQELDWTGYYRDWARNLRDSVPGAGSPFYSVSWFVYPFGANVFTRGWLRGGNAAVRELAKSFPTHTADFMARIDGDQLSDDAPALDCSVSPPGSHYERVGFDRFGGMQLYAFLSENQLDESDAWSRGKRWRDDLLWVYSDDNAEHAALSWRIRLGDADSADVVVDAANRRPTLRAERIGHDALIIGSDDEAVLADWQGARDCR